MFKITFFFGLVLGFSFLAVASTQKRQSVQNKRIEKDVNSVSMTPIEARKFDARQKKVKRKSNRTEKTTQNIKHDGKAKPFKKRKVTRQKVNLINTQDRQSKKNNSKKTNLRKNTK